MYFFFSDMDSVLSRMLAYGVPITVATLSDYVLPSLLSGKPATKVSSVTEVLDRLAALSLPDTLINNSLAAFWLFQGNLSAVMSFGEYFRVFFFSVFFFFL